MASLFRDVYRELTDEEKAIVADVKAKAQALEGAIQVAVNKLEGRGTRYAVQAVTALEAAVMWTVKMITH